MIISIELENKIKFIENIFGGFENGSRNNLQVKCVNCIKNNFSGSEIRKRKFAISLEKNLVCKCWVCGYTNSFLGTLYEFFGKRVYCDYIKQFGIQNSYIRVDDIQENVEYPSNFRLLVFEKNAFVENVKKYFYKRGGTQKDLWYFRVGISSINDYKWGSRIIMPSYNSYGDLNYVCGRDITDTLKYKYCDSNVSKKNIIFNEINIDWNKELTITEGIFDLIKCNENAVPLLGSNLSPDSLLVLNIIKNKTPILLALDKDMESSKMIKIADFFTSFDVKVRILNMGKFRDVGEMTKEDFSKLSKESDYWSFNKKIKTKIDNLSSWSIL